MVTSRELVYQTLQRENPSRAPRQVWLLPWAQLHHPEAVEQINRDFPPDIIHANGHLREALPVQGDPCAVGTYIDEWGCRFENIQAGVIGEVKVAQVNDWDEDGPKIRIPREWLSIDPEAVNRDCAASEQFVLAGCCPRPFEQLQFLRGTAQLYMDLLAPPPAMERFMARMHAFYCELLELWASKTNVDALMFMDDWGSQLSLLINPEVWRAVFKPMYRDYARIARRYGKKLFMHSDGHILAIYPDLIEIGVDAVNSQIFCMGLEKLEPFAGRITFWGEIDRQHLLPQGTPEEIAAAVREVHARLWKNGGCIAQCEFGAGANPANVRQTFTTWDELTTATPVG